MTELVAVSGVTMQEAASLLFALNAQWQEHAHTIQYISELSSEEREETDGILRAMFASQLYRSYFESARPMLNRRAVRYIDELLAKPS